MQPIILKIIVACPAVGALDYLNNEESSFSIGDRCIVPLGPRKVVGLVVGFSETSDYPVGKLRKVVDKIDDVPPLSGFWLELTKFAAKYYLSNWGEVAIAALPKFFRSLPGKRHQASLARLRRKQAVKKTKALPSIPVLNDEQRYVVNNFRTEGFNVGLLFGVTGSGKTEVYLRLIQNVLDKDSDAQILLMVPEINLTPQLVERIRNRFPEEEVVTWNSSLAEQEKARSWLSTHEGRARILVGTRLSVFSSFRKLSMIIIDEEHDSSFKSLEGVRYSARDLAIKKAHLQQIPILLGSATPSFETFSKALENKYQMFRMTRRASDSATLPQLELIDLRRSKESGGLSAETKKAITETLEKKEQVLIFLNRRGYAPVVMCNSCGWTSTCPHCSAYAVFHKTTGNLCCHYCGWTKPLPRTCPKCGSLELHAVGKGTQRIEEEISALWPNANLARMDQDSTRRKGSAEKVIEDVHSGNVDILVGTQMIAKGHDFKKVSLVAILNSDAQLLSSDFRARERLFSVLMQVSGRSGRADVAGKVLLQTLYVSDPLFVHLANQDYFGFAVEELKTRQMCKLPPYSAQALLVAEGKEVNDVLDFLADIKWQASALSNEKIRIYDPVPQAIVKIQDVERAQLLFESDSRRDLLNYMNLLYANMRSQRTRLRWYFDVDPLNY